MNMSTTKKRLNISLSPELEAAVAEIARRDKTPQATKISQLLEIALELEEDEVWDRVAMRRDTKDARFIDHAQAWK